MKTVGELKKNIRSSFQGGETINLDFDSIIEYSITTMLSDININTAIEEVEIFGGLSSHIRNYYNPSKNVITPIEITDQKNVNGIKYLAPARAREGRSSDFFSLTQINGLDRLIVDSKDVFRGVKDQICIFDKMWTLSQENSSQAFTKYGTKVGSTSLRVSFNQQTNSIKKTLESPLNLTESIDGILRLDVIVDDHTKIEDIKVVLESSTGNSVTLSLNGQGNLPKLKDGYNEILLSGLQRSTDGNFDVTNVTAVEIQTNFTGSEENSITFDNIFITSTQRYVFKFYTNKLILDNENRKPQSEVTSDSNLVNLNDSAYEILKNLCILRGLSEGNSGVEGITIATITQNLEVAREKYKTRYPDEEQLATYKVRRGFGNLE